MRVRDDVDLTNNLASRDCLGEPDKTDDNPMSLSALK